MEFTVNKLQEEDYNKFVNWWIFMRFPVPPKESLPNNGLGGIKLTDENGIDCCVGYLFETNSNLAWLEFIVANPNIKDNDIRHKMLVELIATLTLQARNKGFKAVFASISNENLIKKYLEVGYIASKIKTTELIINL
jgi:hypothetical protein